MWLLGEVHHLVISLEMYLKEAVGGRHLSHPRD